MHGRRGHLVERAVHAVANLELRFEGFEVNVARLFLDGLGENQVNETDDRRRVRIGLFLGLLCGEAQLFEDLIESAGTRAVVLVDQALHLRFAGNDRHDVLAEGKAQIFEQLRIERVRECDVHALGIKAHREGSVKLGHRSGHHTDEFRWRLKGLQVEMLSPDFLGYESPELVLVSKDAEIEENLEDVLAAFDGFVRDVIGNAFVDDASRLEHVHYVLCSHWRGKLERLKTEMS